MSFRRTVTTVAVTTTAIAGLALGGSAAATASPGGKPASSGHPAPPCGGVTVTGLTTMLSDGTTPAMTLDVTLNHGVGRVVAVVGNSDGVLEYGPLAPSGTPGGYTGVFLPPSGTPVANGDTVLVIGCVDHWLTSATVGTDWTPGPGHQQGGPGEPTRKPGGTPPGSSGPTGTDASGCVGAQILSVSSALTPDGTGVSFTITVNQSLGRNFSAALESGGQVVGGGAVSEVSGQPGTYQGTLTMSSGATVPADAQVVFGSCGGTPNRIGGTTTVGSSAWSPVK